MKQSWEDRRQKKLTKSPNYSTNVEKLRNKVFVIVLRGSNSELYLV